MKAKPTSLNSTDAACVVCDGAMEYVRTIPAAEGLPELHTFRCGECGSLRTIEPIVEQVRAAA
jgi:hypothetical protein